MPLVESDRDDYTEAAELRNTCRRLGIQLGTVDALIAQVAIRHNHRLLTTDRDFVHSAPHIGLAVWKPSSPRH